MIKVNELRVGSRIDVQTEGNINSAYLNATISAILPEGVFIKGFPDTFSYSWLNPIPITERWLRKSGFKEIDSIYRKELGKGSFLTAYPIGLNHNNSKTFYANSNLYLDAKAVFVHQLQDLYYQITGNELEFNEKSSS